MTLLVALVVAFGPQILEGHSAREVLPLIALVVAIGGIVTGMAFFTVRNQGRFRAMQWDD
jgi:hypothetical protein